MHFMPFSKFQLPNYADNVGMQFQPPIRHACALSHLLCTNHFFSDHQLCLSYCSSPNLMAVGVGAEKIPLQWCIQLYSMQLAHPGTQQIQYMQCSHSQNASLQNIEFTRSPPPCNSWCYQSNLSSGSSAECPRDRNSVNP